MMNKIFFFLIVALFSCDKTNVSNKTTSASSSQIENIGTSAEFNAYWYAGKAEINRYELEQARYGEMRKGDAVLVFVTEPFSKQKQVKLDDANANPNDVVQVLKLNFTKKFDTGIYPYSVMTSAFTPVDVSQKTVKVTSSMQEWCGHVFTQLNLKNKQYVANVFSYFESEGDKKSELGEALSEDGIWSTLRINPTQLPQGKIKIIPSLSYLRFSHKELKAMEATASLSTTNFNQIAVSQYLIQYESRSLKIYFEPKSPFKIQGWEETYKDGAQNMTTRGTLKKSMMLDYWSHNKNADDALRADFYK